MVVVVVVVVVVVAEIIAATFVAASVKLLSKLESVVLTEERLDVAAAVPTPDMAALAIPPITSP